MDDAAFATQLAMEEQMVLAGQQQFWAQINRAKQAGRETDTPYGVQLMAGAVEPVSAAITSRINSTDASHLGIGYRYLRLLPPDIAAYIGLRGVVAGISHHMTLTHTAVRIGTAIEDEVRLTKFKEDNPRLFDLTNRTLERRNRHKDREHRRAVLHSKAAEAGVEHDRWPLRDRLLIGVALVDLIVQHTGLVQLVKVPGRKSSWIIEPTDKTREWIDQALERMATGSAERWPMIVPPKPWTTPRDGGYWSPLVGMALVIAPTRGARKAHREYVKELRKREMPEVYAALNAVQATPWRINRKVLDVMAEALNRKVAIAGLPEMDDIAMPPYPLVDTDTAKTEWKAAAARVHMQNRLLRSHRILALGIVRSAERFKEHASIYFPHRLDFRGRMYVVPHYLSPQGPDYSKALLEFAEGKPLATETSAGWLAVHGANTYGVNKQSLEDRVQWVEQNSDQIVASARDPWSNLAFWAEADEPWMFLAFCFEWAGFVDSGAAFVSHIPVSLDGSCNGLQHFGAMLRDEEAGRAVNLTPSSKPQDIYSVVAERAKAAVDDDKFTSTDKDAWFAERWLEFGLDRKITKRPVMTLPYGSTRHSCRQFIEDAMRDKIAKGAPNVFRHMLEVEDGKIVESEGVFAASLYLMPRVWEAIGQTVQSALRAMTWLQDTAKVIAKSGNVIKWTTPDGFLVMQAYPNDKPHRIETHLDGRTVKLTLIDEADDLNAQRMAAGIAPNFVHSMDATALRRYVNLAVDNGITNFALVHDCYGTLAADVDMMGACLRKAFVDLYEENDVLAQFRETALALVEPEKAALIPPVPPKGNLDLRLVEQSDFFFA